MFFSSVKIHCTPMHHHKPKTRPRPATEKLHILYIHRNENAYSPHTLSSSPSSHTLFPLPSYVSPAQLTVPYPSTTSNPLD